MFLGGAVVARRAGRRACRRDGAVALAAAGAAGLAAAGARRSTLLFLAGNLALQYGAARLPANRTAVVMLTEVVFASLSAVAFGGGDADGARRRRRRADRRRRGCSPRSSPPAH